MDTLLILLGVLGFAIILISVHIYSKDSETYGEDVNEKQTGAAYRDRVQGDRRSGLKPVFPLLINGIPVNEDRRSLPDRRQSFA